MREPDRSNLASFYDPDWRSGPDLEWRMEQAQELKRERLDREVDRILAEIDAGDHDSDLTESPLLDASTVMRIARQCARDAKLMVNGPDLGDLRNLRLQIQEYAQDLAERRML